MLWFWLALLCALLMSLQHLSIKLAVARADPYVAAWGHRLFSLFFLIPALLIYGHPLPAAGTWQLLCVTIVVAAAAVVLYTTALKESELSLVAPLLGFTPVFLLLLSPLMLHETANIWGTAGVLLVVAGTYLMHIAEQRRGLWAPLLAVFRHHGSRLMLVVALLYGIWANLQKIGTLMSSPLYWTTLLNVGITIVLLPLMFIKSKSIGAQLKGSFGALLAAGLCNAVLLVTEVVAFKLTLVAYVISVKRTSLLISVLLGWFVLKESDIRPRLFGTAVMLGGLLLIYLLGA